MKINKIFIILLLSFALISNKVTCTEATDATFSDARLDAIFSKHRQLKEILEILFKDYANHLPTLYEQEKKEFVANVNGPEGMFHFQFFILIFVHLKDNLLETIKKDLENELSQEEQQLIFEYIDKKIKKLNKEFINSKPELKKSFKNFKKITNILSNSPNLMATNPFPDISESLTNTLAAKNSKCFNCSKKLKRFKLCTRCKIAKYCDDTCAKNDWSKHKNSCKVISAICCIGCSQIENDDVMLTKCPNCETVYYCSENCRNHHWIHEGCKAKNQSDKGDNKESNSNIAKNECAGLNCPNKEKTDIKLSKCSRCKTIWYCSKECQKAHWKTHKPNCKKQDDSTSATAESTSNDNGGSDKCDGKSNTDSESTGDSNNKPYEDDLD